jgi:Protein of unknown function (DUF1254)
MWPHSLRLLLDIKISPNSGGIFVSQMLTYRHGFVICHSLVLRLVRGGAGAAGPTSKDRRRSSRSRSRHRDDDGLCTDGGAHGLPVGLAAGQLGQPLPSFSKAPEPFLMGGIVPVAYNANAMLTGYVSPDQTFVTCANQDVVYGTGYMGLDKEPIVFQVPDFGDRFWVYAHYDARTDEFSEIGKAYGTKPGFYLMVGPNWKGETPAGITAVVRSSTSLVFVIPRIFMDDTPEDKVAVQPLISQVIYYPLSQFDGKMKIKDWSKLPVFPMPKSTGSGETKYVNPETFFDELPAVIKQVPPLPGEEALYKWISSVLDAAAKDPAIMQTRKETAVAAESECSRRSSSGATTGVPPATAGTRQ